MSAQTQLWPKLITTQPARFRLSDQNSVKVCLLPLGPQIVITALDEAELNSVDRAIWVLALESERKNGAFGGQGWRPASAKNNLSAGLSAEAKCTSAAHGRF